MNDQLQEEGLAQNGRIELVGMKQRSAPTEAGHTTRCRRKASLRMNGYSWSVRHIGALPSLYVFYS